MINVAVLGAGFMGSTHAHAYAKLPSVRLAAIVDPIEEKSRLLAVELNTAALPDAIAVLNDPSIDIIDITLPTALHRDYALRALQAGKHVLVEKPFALNLEEIDDIIAAQKIAGNVLMVAQVLRFSPEYATIRQVVQSGRLGKPVAAYGYRLTNPPQWASWFANVKISGGTVLDLMIHDLDVMNWMFGKPEYVSAVGVRGQGGNWPHAIAQLHYPDLVATDEVSHAMPLDYPFTAGLRLVCEGGAIEYHLRAGGASFEQGKPEHYLLIHEPGRPSQPLAFTPDDLYEREVAYFVQCVQNRVQPVIVTPQDARLAVQTALAVVKSLESGQTIRLE
jgi:predicted dehydrogenase